MSGRRRARFWLAIGAGVLVLLLVVAALVWRDDIVEALLDPKIPYTVYRPPPRPDYARASSWALLGASRGPDPAFDVFFVHPTTFDGGRDWNGPIADPRSAAVLARVMLPNYAAPFADDARVFAPRYRQASLYTSLSLFDDAIEAREFAYGDILTAFHAFLDRMNGGRPFILVGVEQGGGLADRLVREVVAPDPALRRRLVSAYLIDTVVPAERYPPGLAGACAQRDEVGCVVAWMSVRRGDFARVGRILSRSLVWDDRGRLKPLAGRAPLCVNPLLGARSDAPVAERLNLGAANATGLEWGARPGFMARQVAAQCQAGLLRVSRARSPSLRASGDLAERLKVSGFNLFYADLAADAKVREARWLAENNPVTPPR